MNIGKACGIFEQLDSDKFTDEEKALAIYEVMNMPTHMSVTKYCMLKAIKWLWNKAYYFDESEVQENDRHTESKAD